VHGLAIMGAVEVKMRLPGESDEQGYRRAKRERRAARHEERRLEREERREQRRLERGDRHKG
jgi:hypothetical protein